MASRSAAGTGWADGRISKSIMVFNFLPRPQAGRYHESGLFAMRSRWACRRAGSSAGYSLGDVVADLDRGPRGPGALPLDQVVGDRLLDPRGLGGKPEVLAEHGGGQDGRRGVGLLLAG